MKYFSAIGIFTVIAIMIACSSVKFSGIEAIMPDMHNKSDGIYLGTYNLSGTPVKVTLDVTVQNRNIDNINIIKHKCSPIGKKAEKIIERIIEEQSLSIDAVSGATGSSVAILKAVENALE